MEQTKPKGLFARFWPYLRKYRKIMIFDLACAALTTVCDMVLPLIMRYLTNTALTDAAALTVQAVLQLGLLYLVLRLIDGAANYYMASMGHIMGVYVETDMRRDAFDHLQKLGHTYYSNTKVGQIMGRITNDLFDVTEFSHHCPEEFFIAGIKIVASPAGGILRDQIGNTSKMVAATALPTLVLVIVFMFIPRGSQWTMAAVAVSLIFTFIYRMGNNLCSVPFAELNVPSNYLGTAIGMSIFLGYCSDWFLPSMIGRWMDALGGNAYYYIFSVAVAGLSIFVFGAYLLKRELLRQQRIENH